MKISEKQLLTLTYILHNCYSMDDIEILRPTIKKLLTEIREQQSDELREIE